MSEQLVKQIRQCPSLPSVPAIALQVVDLAQRDEVDIAEIARVISRDPALSSKILRTVNSSFYGRSQSISTISHALVILGLQSVKTLVLGFSLVTNLSRTKSKGFKHLHYWRRSMYAATAARLLAAKLQFVQQEECFLAALLQDIGMLVLDQVLGQSYGDIHEKVNTHDQLVEFEQQALGMNHAEVSGIMAELWKLPPVLSVPMAKHHCAATVEDVSLRKLVELVYLAGQCADVFVDEQAATPIAAVRRCCLDRYGISESDCDALLNEICQRAKEIAPLFDVSIADSTNYESILKRANETLVELTLRTQQQAASLEKQNLRLQEQATVDGLTSLANRATFDSFITDKFATALAQGKPLAMLMIDVDHFKMVNDQYGHPAGDQVLRRLGKILRTAARSQDLAARYGGEEMVLVMPSTTRASAAIIAESVRRAIAAKPVLCDNSVQIPVTVSVGVAAMEPGTPFTQQAHLIKAADMALYAAKKGGRNCVKVFALKPPVAKVA